MPGLDLLPASVPPSLPCDLEPVVACAGPQFSCELKSFNSDSLGPSCQLPQPFKPSWVYVFSHMLVHLVSLSSTYLLMPLECLTLGNTSLPCPPIWLWFIIEVVRVLNFWHWVCVGWVSMEEQKVGLVFGGGRGSFSRVLPSLILNFVMPVCILVSSLYIWLPFSSFLE